MPNCHCVANTGVKRGTGSKRQQEAANTHNMSIPYISASGVAAAIGEHRYQDMDAAFFTILTYAPEWQSVIEEVKAELGMRTEGEVFAAAMTNAPALGRAVEVGIAAAVGAGSDAAVQAAIDGAVAQGLAALPATTSLDAVALVQAGIVQAVQTQRGAVLEEVALDAHEVATRAVIGHRNTKMMYLRTPHYVIGGRIDGYDAAANRVVEVKNRKRVWAKVPTYDLVQLRVYVQMMGAKHEGATGMLLDRFPDGSTRETVLECDPAEWERIHALIMDKVVARFQALTRDDVVTLVAKCCV